MPQLEQGRQLGFIAALGGSKKNQITHVYGLRAEIDLPDSKPLQRAVYAAVEARYGIRFTLLDTGGKSIHAWLASATPIPASRYSLTSQRWHALIYETAADAGLDVPAGALDVACHRPTQVMRLPGAIHLKTRQTAEVIQWGQGPVSLEQLGVDWPTAEAWAKEVAAPRTAVQTAIARTCRAGAFLGRTGDERTDLLVELARAVPVRVPGAGTYGTVFRLVCGLTRALGPKEAARVLHHAGHLDKNGDASPDGLLAWCRTLDHDPEHADEHLASLTAWAQQHHSWERPSMPLPGVLQPTVFVEANPTAISEAFWDGTGLVVCGTGAGKTEAACLYVERMAAAKADISVAVISPRQTINAQVADKMKAVNVSARLSGGIHPYKSPGTQLNRYVCCIQSLGNLSKLNGDRAFWGEYWSYGDTGSPPRYVGRGAMVTLLVLEEVRQMLCDLLLSPCCQGSIWESAADRWRAGVALVRSIDHAGGVLAMDAQAGEPERELLRGQHRREAGRVIGCAATAPSRTMRWTSEQGRWRDALIGYVQKQVGKGKPVLVVTATKGKEGETRRGLSARALRDAVRAVVPECRVLIIDVESKDSEIARRVLLGQVEDVDLVICTPVAQSGVSWVNVFAETVFVAGGRTLPPNICGGQAGRRERTATTCVAYVPKTVWDNSLPVLGTEVDAIHDELRLARQQCGDVAIASGREIDLLERVYVLAVQRQIEELVLFRDYTLHYARQDGWATEELEAVIPLPRLSGTGGGANKRTEPLAYSELDPWREVLVRSLRLQAAGAHPAVEQTKSSASQMTLEAQTGSAGGDLLSANLTAVLDLFLEAGLGLLCDGTSRAGDDPQVVETARLLKTPQAAAILRRATWLQLDLKGGETHPARTIGTAIRALGGISVSKKVGGRGAQVSVYRWLLPGDAYPAIPPFL
ncbi:MAG: DEAD/DEAH box helicase family protein [Synechococcus sp.]